MAQSLFTHAQYLQRFAELRQDLVQAIAGKVAGAPGAIEFDPFIGSCDDEGEINVRGVFQADGGVGLTAEYLAQHGETIPDLPLESASLETLGRILQRIEG